MAVRMAEIAAAARVSRSTVSAIINKKTTEIRISDETKDKVLKIAESLNYHPNKMAQGLASGKTYNLGVALYDLQYLTSYYFFSTLGGIAYQAAQQDYHIQFVTTVRGKPSPETANLHYEKKVVEGSIDGLVIMDQVLSDAEIMKLHRKGFPVILVDRIVEGMESNSVLIDGQQGFYKATKHLIEDGHKKIVAILGPSEAYYHKIKFAGYEQALKELGMSNNSQSLFITRNDRKEEMIKEFMKGLPIPSAVICSCDDYAVSLLGVLYDLGIKVPDDVAIVGFGDEPIATSVRPLISTLKAPYEKVGSTAVQMLLGLLGLGKRVVGPVLFDPALVIRDSSRHL